jgi:hypothetical protein
MTAATHRALLALDLYAVDDTHAREIVDLAAASVAPLAGVLALEASPPNRRRPIPAGLERDADPGVWLSTTDGAAAGALIRAYLRTHDALLELGHVPAALPHRNKLEELADRLDDGRELEPLPAIGEVYPLHRGSRA